MLRNWKTTLTGFAFGVVNLWASGVNFKSAVISVGLATMGALAKDHNVSGVK